MRIIIITCFLFDIFYIFIFLLHVSKEFFDCILFFFAVLFVLLCFFRFSILCFFLMVDLQTDLSDPVFVHLLYF